VARPESDLIGDHTCDGRPSDAAKVGRFHHDCHAGSQLDFIGALVDNHAPESGHVVENRLHVTENNPGLLFISSETHDDESFTDRDEWLEGDEAGDEAGGQGRYEGFPATTTNDEICPLSPPLVVIRVQYGGGK
jgi:hypothetical protein